MISEWLWPRCLELVPGWSDDRWTSVRHTHTHNRKEGWKHTSDTYARTHTHTHIVHARMNVCSHINSEVRKACLNTQMHTHIHRLPHWHVWFVSSFCQQGRMSQHVMTYYLFFNMHDSLQSILIKFESRYRTFHVSVVVGCPHDYLFMTESKG